MSDGAAAPGSLTPRQRQLVLWALFAGVFIGTFDQTFVVTLLPEMMSDLGVSADRLGDATWIVNGYLIGYVLALPVFGRAADVYGRLRIYMIATAVEIVGTAVVAAAPNLEVAAAARAVSAIGGGALVPIGLSIAANLVTEKRRPLVLGVLLAGQNASSLVGPLWGAGLSELFGWRGVFWINIPLMLPVAWAVYFTLRRERDSRGGSLDATGIAYFTAALLLVTVALSDDPSNPRPLWVSIGMILAGFGALGLFIARERRAADPMIDLQLFSRRPVVAAGIAYTVLGGVLIIALVTVPLMRNTLYGGTTLDGAVALMGLLVALPIGGVLGGYLVAVVGFRGTAVLGIALTIGGVLWMHGWRDVITSYEMWPALLLVGLGLGLCDAPLVGTVVENAREEQRAAATSMILVLWTVGMVIGLALLGSRGLGRFEDRAANLFTEQGLTAESPQYLAAIHTTYEEVLLVTAVALGVALVASLGLRRGDRPVSKWMRVPGVL